MGFFWAYGLRQRYVLLRFFHLSILYQYTDMEMVLPFLEISRLLLIQFYLYLSEDPECWFCIQETGH